MKAIQTITLSFCLLLLSACSQDAAGQAETIQFISAEQAVEQIESGRAVLDVRSRAEWLQGHLAPAQHVPVNRIAEFPADQLPDPKTPVLLYCKAGVRAQRAAETLAQRGFKQLYVVKPGGYQELAKALAAK